jgi:hypothetical protein
MCSGKSLWRGPDEQTGLYDVFKAVPKPELWSEAERYPRANESDEAELSKAFKALALMDSAQAATELIALEALHGKTARGGMGGHGQGTSGASFVSDGNGSEGRVATCRGR